MKAQISNIRNLQIGNTVRLTYKSGRFYDIKVVRIEDKSWYDSDRNRRSYGTLEDYFKCPKDIIKCEIF